MLLCDNIFSLSDSMTRVEKYRTYRKEISNMKFETFSQKKLAAEQLEELHNENLGSKLNYEQVMVVHDVFNDGEEKHKKRRLINLTKYEILYYLIAFCIFVIILVALILTGIKL